MGGNSIFMCNYLGCIRIRLLPLRCARHDQTFAFLNFVKTLTRKVSGITSEAEIRTSLDLWLGQTIVISDTSIFFFGKIKLRQPVEDFISLLPLMVMIWCD